MFSTYILEIFRAIFENVLFSTVLMTLKLGIEFEINDFSDKSR